MNYTRVAFASLIAMSTAFLGCKDKTLANNQAQPVSDAVAKTAVVDSAVPIAEQLDRFQKTIPEKTDTLRHASKSITSLVTRWTLAVASSDTAALNAMILDRAEFAYLYYPGSKMSLPPYEAPPQVLWGQMLASSEDGAQNILKLFSAGSFKVGGVNCPTPPVVEGANKLHEGCTLKVERAGASSEGSYFGTIIERDGRFKFVSYASRQ